MTRWVFVVFGIVGISVIGASDPELSVEQTASKGPPVLVHRGSSHLVCLDPGHGGANSGAPGTVQEKDYTLELALELEAELVSRGYEVVLTRRRDTTLNLGERGAIAERTQSDAFISIHANASKHHDQRGFETYVLSEDAAVIDAAALRADPQNRQQSLIRHALSSRAQINSARLGRQLQGAMITRLGKRGDRGLKQESMHVLLGLTIPAALVEVGFIDHPTEGALLTKPAHKRVLVTALADGIDSYFQLRQ